MCLLGESLLWILTYHKNVNHHMKHKPTVYYLENQSLKKKITQCKYQDCQDICSMEEKGYAQLHFIYKRSIVNKCSPRNLPSCIMYSNIRTHLCIQKADLVLIHAQLLGLINLLKDKHYQHIFINSVSIHAQWVLF